MNEPSGAIRVRAAFRRAAESDRAALIAYLMAGFPDENGALSAAEAALDAGVDLLEVGVPFSDPMADGPVIAAAGRTVLEAGGGIHSALRLVGRLRERGHELPVLIMSYLNPLLAGGHQASLRRVAESGADGLIVPDLPAGADTAFERLVRDAGLAQCALAAPNTGRSRLEAAIAASSGFLYVVPLFGVTGARDRLSERAAPLLRQVREVAAGRVPVAAGFGISRPEQVAALAPLADGLVVGSALVAALAEKGPEHGPRAVGDLIAALATASRLTGAAR